MDETNGVDLSPLVVDLDGTLTSTDTLAESVVGLIKEQPLLLLLLPFWLLGGRAAFKARIASRFRLAADGIPYRADLLAYLHEQRQSGRRLVLATAAHVSIAEGVAMHLGIFDTVLASDASRNLKSSTKLAAIRSAVGDRFSYAGDSRADIPIWKQAKTAILVGVSRGVDSEARRVVEVERSFGESTSTLREWLKALRAHQWMKNLLIFVPLFTAFSFTDPQKVLHALVAFGAFCMAASGTYLANDLSDLRSDRAHARKRLRPFARGTLPVAHGALVAILLCVGSILVASTISLGLTLMVLSYLVITTFYSGLLKQLVILDVVVLAVLYTLRILTGAVATDTRISPWLLAFSVFIFLSLALVKRCAELVSLQPAGGQSARGREYRVSDLAVLWPLGVSSAMAAIVVFGLFISAPETQERYQTPELLWLVALGLVYWLARLWIKTSRAEMHDDPLVYAIKDRASHVTVFGMLAVTLLAHLVRAESFF